MPKAKMDEDKLRELNRMLEEKWELEERLEELSFSNIAKYFGITKGHLWSIRQGHYWKKFDEDRV
jgi:hypothetical protein